MPMKLPRLNKQRLFKDLGYEPHPGQLAVHQSSASRRILACGVRWGKTTCAAMEGIAAVLSPCEKSVGWIVGPNYQVSDRIFRIIHEVLEAHLPHRLESVSMRERVILVRNLGGGVSELRSKSADNTASLLGEGLSWLVIDEAARLREEVWSGHLSQRLIDRAGWALLISTPMGRNWFHRLFQRGQGGDQDFESWNRPSIDNPLLDPSVIEKERALLTAEEFEQEYMAAFIGGLDQCLVCGDPDPDVPGLVLLVGEECEDAESFAHVCDVVLSCPRCDAPVDEQGHTYRTVKDGEPFIEAIILGPDVPRPSVPIPV